MSSTNKIIMVGAGCVVAAAALWYLARDPNEKAFDSKVHTVEELRKIIRELFLEGATAYTHKLNMLLNLKKSDELSEEVFQNMLTKCDAEMDEIEREIYEEKGFSEFFVTEWLARFKDDPEIKKSLAQL